ncbi:hypothetical protein NC661_03070 [Aquibacillus koreensis]|uniref:Uncharacterized protein n=1 Tax=Aquibacillus koreensis TaxID=279446 RepID=A0A9X3WIR7_9BACI|nr:hypothetical protein [Aquibacillus koreensis]
MSLEEIKKRIVKNYAEEIDVTELRLKIKGLEKEVSEILYQLNENEKKLEYVQKNISKESLSLIQSLLLLIN